MAIYGDSHEPQYIRTTEGFRLRRGQTAADMNQKWFNYYARGECSFWRMKLQFMEFNDNAVLDTKKFITWLEGLGWRVNEADKKLADVQDYNYIDKLERLVKSGAFGNNWH